MARCFFVVQVEPGRVLRLQLKANRPLRTLLRNDEIRDACSRGGVVCWRSTGEAVPLNETGVQQQLPSAEKHRPGLSVHLVITQPGTVSDAQSASSASSEPPEGLDAAGVDTVAEAAEATEAAEEPEQDVAVLAKRLEQLGPRQAHHHTRTAGGSSRAEAVGESEAAEAAHRRAEAASEGVPYAGAGEGVPPAPPPCAAP
eukprot:TRINITY_DN13535_c0_g1_i2.p3 TRINITY_DN13535_c0_g1~~TRINITY_DN13535_c0_g1_i2.p3  ORF type:complete len:217 (+),score=41.05 TRINITY_DN13535_c0_g1_i2:54-653(+)